MKIKKSYTKQSEEINYIRESHWEMTTLDNFMLDGLQSTTFINGKKDLIANDSTVLSIYVK
jgi:hypothetical protein